MTQEIENRLISCHHVMPDGSYCKAPAIGGEDWCWFHHPGEEWAEARRTARHKSGKRGRYSKVIIPDPAKDASFLTASVRALIEDIQGRAANKRDDALLLRSLAEYRACLEWSYRFSEFEERLAELERNA